MSTHDQVQPFLQAALHCMRNGEIGQMKVSLTANGDLEIDLTREQQVMYVPQDTSSIHYGHEARRPAPVSVHSQDHPVVTPEDEATRALRLPIQDRSGNGGR